jgi:hypothetical protein
VFFAGYSRTLFSSASAGRKVLRSLFSSRERNFQCKEIRVRKKVGFAPRRQLPL